MQESQGRMRRQFRQADVHIVIFPHLRDFIVIDLRKTLPDRPQGFLLNTDDVLGQAFYEQIKEELASVLEQAKKQPHSSLITIPPKIEAAIQRGYFQSILQHIGVESNQSNTPTISLLICANDALDMSHMDITKTMRTIFGLQSDAWVIIEAIRLMEKLLEEEKTHVKNIEQVRLRDAIIGDPEHYRTIWENPL